MCAALAALGLLVGLNAAPVSAAPVAAAPASTSRTAALPDPGAAEADFTARINQLRASKGLGTLSVDAELVREARSWATNMAGQGRIFHTTDLGRGITANWVKLGENVGVGGDVGVLFQAFVDSPTHYDNLVDPRYTTVGVGVVVSGDRIFTTHRFMAVAPPAAPPPPAPAPDPAPVVTTPPTTIAAPTTVPPTTAPTTTVPPVTTTSTIPRPPDAPAPKLGPIERIGQLIAAGSGSAAGS